METPYKVVSKRKRRKFICIDKPEKKEYVDKDTGEIKECVNLVGSSQFFDSTRFVKVFEVDSAIGLGIAGFRMFMYVLKNISYAGTFKLDMNSASDMTGYGRDGIYRGIREMESLGMINRKNKMEWWVNPNIMYIGNRDKYKKQE